MSASAQIALSPASLQDTEKEVARQAAILNLWEAYGLVDDEAVRQLIAFAIVLLAR